MPSYFNSLPEYPEQGGKQSEAQHSYSMLNNLLLVAKCALAIFALAHLFAPSSGWMLPWGTSRAEEEKS
jgi:hypothetical protein